MLVISYVLVEFSYYGMRNLIYASNETRVREETGMASGFAELLTVLHHYRDPQNVGRSEQLTKDISKLEDSSGIVPRRPNMEKQG